MNDEPVHAGAVEMPYLQKVDMLSNRWRNPLEDLSWLTSTHQGHAARALLAKIEGEEEKHGNRMP